MMSGATEKAAGGGWGCRSKTSTAKTRVDTSKSTVDAKREDGGIEKENKIFISWSGNGSNEVALELKECLENEIFENEDVECFVSDLDIASGTDWWNKIKDELRTSQAGILCITKENLDAAWLYFEAGALVAQEVPTIPLLIHCSSKVLNNTPLSSKQAIDFCKQDRFRKMIVDLRKALGFEKLGKNQLQVLVRAAYANLKDRLEPVLKQLESTSAFSRKYVYPPEIDCIKHKTIYISVPMSSISAEEYDEIRKHINELEPLLNEIGFVEVTCPIFDIETADRFDGKTKAIKDNFPKMKQVDSMLVIYPRQVPSSTLVEIGYALALSKKMVIFHKEELPYILTEAGETISNIRTYKYTDFETIKDIICKNEMTLFEGGTQLA